MEISGFDDLERNLQRLQWKAEALDGTHDVPLPELMPDAFVRHHSRFDSLQALADASGIEEAEEIGGEKWNAFIAENTSFPDWTEMLKAATAERTARKLGF
jgi:hypothetical protein